jgi:pilus assembly protein CpaE
MKIALISPNPQHLSEAGAALQARGYECLLFEGGKSRMREVAERDRPDAILVDGICCDPLELAHVEHVTTHHPSIAVILLCSTHTPEFLINAMRAGVREVLPSPADAAALDGAVRRVAAKLGMPAARESGTVLAFMACKGGSGATFLATNFAWELAQSRPVLLIDLNLQFGDALSHLHDGRPPATIADVAREIGRLDASLLAASTVRAGDNLSILAAPEDLGHAMEVQPEHVDAILAIARQHYDFIVVDVPRTLDPVAIKALDRAARIFVVLQAQLPDLRHAARLLEAFKSLGYPADKAELVVNRLDRRAEIGIDQVRRSLGAARVSTLSNAWREAASSINHGEPLAQSARTIPLSREIALLAQAFSPRAAAEPRAGFARLFGRA